MNWRGTEGRHPGGTQQRRGLLILPNRPSSWNIKRIFFPSRSCFDSSSSMNSGSFFKSLLGFFISLGMSRTWNYLPPSMTIQHPINRRFGNLLTDSFFVHTLYLAHHYHTTCFRFLDKFRVSSNNSFNDSFASLLMGRGFLMASSEAGVFLPRRNIY